MRLERPQDMRVFLQTPLIDISHVKMGPSIINRSHQHYLCHEVF